METGLSKTSRLTESTISLLTDKPVHITPYMAWRNGTNIGVALKDEPTHTRAWLLKEVIQLVKDIDATKTLSTDGEFKFTCRAIIDEHPTIKLEEIVIAFNNIRMGVYGKLFERLKTAEILHALRRYEGETRCDIMENAHHNEKHAPFDWGAIDATKLLEGLPDPDTTRKGGSGTRMREYLDRALPNSKE